MKIKSKLKIIITITLVIMTGIFYSQINTVKANENKLRTTNVEKMNTDEVRKMTDDIISGILENDASSISKYSQCLTSEVDSQLNKYTANNNLKGSIIERIIDYIDTKNSDTEDYVIMVNTRLQLAKAGYNELVMFEFHVNKDGKIYGYNVWAY